MERTRAKRKTCYYKVLGIRVGATQDEIRGAFRYLAMKLHPDRNPGDPKAAERFREVRKAYEILKDPATRGRYDRIRGYGKPKRKSTSSSSWTDIHEHGGEANSFDEIFQDVFGMGRPQVRTQHGCDLRFDIQIARSALRNGGCHEEICYGRIVFCRNCNNGIGRLGCPTCGGAGEYEQSCSLRVWIPATIEDGMRIRVAGGGDGRSASVPPGDLILLVSVIEGC
ncbi:MAG: DnaJ domain-containing protein [Desulfobacteraceae bacterium]|nr:DnaJ domain-containing protein [Desulfobacteraceae bacterium]